MDLRNANKGCDKASESGKRLWARHISRPCDSCIGALARWWTVAHATWAYVQTLCSSIDFTIECCAKRLSFFGSYEVAELKLTPADIVRTSLHLATQMMSQIYVSF